MLIIIILSFTDDVAVLSQDECWCKLTAGDELDTIKVRSFMAESAQLRGARNDKNNVLAYIGRHMDSAETDRTRQHKCGSISVAVQTEKVAKGNDFVREMVIKMQRIGKNYLNQPTWVMLWTFNFVISDDNNVKATVRHIRVEYPAGRGTLPYYLNPTGRYPYRFEKILYAAGDKWFPFKVENYDLRKYGLEDVGPSITRHSSGQVLIKYWNECGWKVRFSHFDVDFNLHKPDFKPFVDSMCGPCSEDDWKTLKEYKDYWFNGIKNLVEPFRSQCWMDVNTKAANIPLLGGNTPSHLAPDCTEDQYRKFVGDNYCGFVIDKAGPFGECMDKGGLYFSRMKYLLQRCLKEYCLGLKNGEEAGKESLCKSMDRVDYYCKLKDVVSPWKETAQFSYCNN